MKEYISPKDAVLLATRARVPFSASFPGVTGRAPATVSTRTSRSNSRASHKSSTSEKIVVYNDDEIEMALPTGQCAGSANTRGEQSRIMSNPDTKKLIAATHPRAKHIEHAHIEPSSKDNLDVSNQVQRLQEIATERRKLLQRLSDLQEQEEHVLAQLTHGLPYRTPPRRSHSGLEVSAAPSPVRPLKAPLLPMPNASCITSKLPSKTTQKALHARTLSAPALSTPSGPQHWPPSTAKRIPLADKTEEIATEADITSPHVENSPFFPVTRAQHIEQSPKRTDSTGFPEGTSRIPINFGDEPSQSTVRPCTPIHRYRAGNRVNARGRGNSKSRSRSRGRGPATPVTNVFQKMPHTVARKKWDS